jgi:hypothetical protein
MRLLEDPASAAGYWPRLPIPIRRRKINQVTGIKWSSFTVFESRSRLSPFVFALFLVKPGDKTSVYLQFNRTHEYRIPT